MRKNIKNYFLRIKEEWLCLFPLLGLFFVVFTFQFVVDKYFDGALLAQLSLAKTSHNIAVNLSPHLTDDEKLIISNAALIARYRWIYFSCAYICICIVAIVAGFVIAMGALVGNKRRFLIVACLLSIVLSVTSLLRGAYGFVHKLFQETIMASHLTGYASILDFTVSLDKLAFAVAFFLVIVAGLCLLNFRPNQQNAHELLERQMGQLKSLLYIATAVLVFSILFWNFTLRWSLAYIYPSSDAVYKSVEGVVNCMVTARGIYFTAILAVTYIPTAFIQEHRAQTLATFNNPGEAAEKKANWLKERNLTSSALDFAPRLIAILGPLLAGSFTDLLPVLK